MSQGRRSCARPRRWWSGWVDWARRSRSTWPRQGSASWCSPTMMSWNCPICSGRSFMPTQRWGRPRPRQAKASVAAINPGVEVEAIAERIDSPGLKPLLNRIDLVIDATDNFTTRFALNDACWRRGTPLVSGAAIRWEGQVAVFDPRCAASPCYRCLYADGSGGSVELR